MDSTLVGQVNELGFSNVDAVKNRWWSDRIWVFPAGKDQPDCQATCIILMI